MRALAAIVAVSAVFVTTMVMGQEVVSELPDIKAAKVTRLPEGPHPEKQDDNCSSDFAEPTTEAGRYVLDRGWGVLSEVPIGDYQLVSFAGEFVPGTSGSCAVRQGNIGIFDGSKLKAILYTASKTDELIGVLTPNEVGTVRIWSGDYLGHPVADITAGSVGLIVGEIADEDSFCKGTVTVPTVFGEGITKARQSLISAGWDPVPQPKEEWGQQVDLHALGITEAVSCSGTGFGYCSYAYARAGAKLDVTTAGELFEDSVPGVVDYAVTCE
ncbi:MAG: hypothetical protein JNL14_06490 [Devosia sp.]|uniref:hypothetical protein n=1 Tax=Devosia sp. TaxID=1871048 RepID=UPI001A5692D8|nr:hypothetical protein [Devosia sp.]MBL8597369.1 hypothetical protein [Devosia sp.]